VTDELFTPVIVSGKEDLQTEALVLMGRGAQLVVKDKESLDFASAFVRRVKEIRDKVCSVFDPHIKRAFDQHRALVAEKRKFTDELDDAERAVRPKITAYLVEQDRIRMAAEREAAMAQERIEQVSDKAADKAWTLVDDGKGAKATQVMQKAQADIEAIKASATPVPEPVKAEGMVLREVWKFEVVAPDLVPRKFMVPDEVLIRKFVVAFKHQADIPGVRIWSEKTAAVKADRG